MDLTWEPDKTADNRAKHRVAFPDVEAVFYDPYAITREDESSEGEQRWVTLGLDNLGRVVVVVYTYRPWGHHSADFSSAGDLHRNESV